MSQKLVKFFDLYSSNLVKRFKMNTRQKENRVFKFNVILAIIKIKT